LLVHNFYGSAAPSGENQVFEAEKALLQSRGHEVAEFTRHSDEIRGQVFGAPSRGRWQRRGTLGQPGHPAGGGALLA
jgi:hypothetical protein